MTRLLHHHALPYIIHFHGLSEKEKADGLFEVSSKSMTPV
jgi:hypothetical protein